jgi:S-adenosylmethionine:tRNA ribosyltransferase-isomerase
MRLKPKKACCTVGTTSMRAVESFISNTLDPFDGWTNKFVFPPHDLQYNLYDYKFHTPKSTLLMMVSTFCGV